ncbi:MAG: hypothetical protein COV55_04195 [Candidatus Komeilibacteria bacterium CG11_big_fil_rev_8_21_14_0_20_36_20]|uniref:DUF4134 domain-containing protein n=1 Tax=Candidatus Komeilibacteria bacterium CG11_big_fil_rev_8_21_14_0_20_36_20 TaxID=1974477 RepID=A0A2H0NBN4_9BACT|nr:MAG: hypothetical protein COV55_04195 [Candidatus Komeilibacteria bacterium CG11_big_fil_rev_8_21_14_0_20_36_20]PIR81444.1 MAG: hypothetical protein COU21_03425 [Candidatus Komeilibacteria bacterium CG10_big_fil_rev_8_21_14_0_10_36_65]PJC55645.1 MAG: hypothetical protein CO027_00780 [Candidatus Komeilibacteria bacterium CG_4_9_14_0_2_um_filter_36_13]
MKKAKYLFLVLLLLPGTALAQTDPFGLNELSETELGTKDLNDTIAGVINIVLGFLGILAILGIIYGGFKMMTSGGNSQDTDAGKQAVVAGAIGLLIVFAAYAISRFVLNSLVNETI